MLGMQGESCSLATWVKHCSWVSTLCLRLRCSSPDSWPRGVEQLLKPPKDPEMLPSCVMQVSGQVTSLPWQSILGFGSMRHLSRHKEAAGFRVEGATHLRAKLDGIGRLEAQAIPYNASLTLIAALRALMAAWQLAMSL